MRKPYYSRLGFDLYHADCFDMFEDMEDSSVDMIFADPPYFLSSGSFTCQAGRRVSVKKGEWDLSNGTEGNFEFHLRWIGDCKRLLKPDGTIWISGTYHSIYQCGYALQLNGYHILNDIAWFKPNASPNLSCRFFTASHETLIWARKDKKAKHKFDYQLMKTGNWREDPMKKPGYQMRSVWSLKTAPPAEKRFGKHPTQKPLELLKRVILASTEEGDLILDPFTGSSTTGIAAFKCGRRFIGIDTEKKYLDLSRKRYEELSRRHENTFFDSSVPSYVSTWTDKYFHQSASDPLLPLPSKRVIQFLSQFRKNTKITLYRGFNEWNKATGDVVSWTYDRKVAFRFAGSKGKIAVREFEPEEVLLDTTLLTPEQKKQMGYDYAVDDKEVIVFPGTKRT